MEVVLGLPILFIDGLEGTNVLLPLKKLLEVVIAVEVEALVDEVGDTGVGAQHVFNYWVEHGVISEVEAGRLEVNAIFKQTCLEYHVPNKIVVGSYPMCLVGVFEVSLHQFDLICFHVYIRILQKIEVNFINYPSLMKIENKLGEIKFKEETDYVRCR